MGDALAQEHGGRKEDECKSETDGLLRVPSGVGESGEQPDDLLNGQDQAGDGSGNAPATHAQNRAADADDLLDALAFQFVLVILGRGVGLGRRGIGQVIND